MRSGFSREGLSGLALDSASRRAGIPRDRDLQQRATRLVLSGAAKEFGLLRLDRRTPDADVVDHAGVVERAETDVARS